jgi:hypothetical protein
MRRPEASGTKNKSEKNDVMPCAKQLTIRAVLIRWHRQDCLCN